MQEAAAVATETESTPTKPETEQTTEKSEEATVTTPSEEKEEPSSPASPSEPTEEGSAKKTKKNKKWSFRSWSFSKKDKVKPNVKEEKQQETVPEVSLWMNFFCSSLQNEKSYFLYLKNNLTITAPKLN